jgi:hypothetical protein
MQHRKSKAEEFQVIEKCIIGNNNKKQNILNTNKVKYDHMNLCHETTGSCPIYNYNSPEIDIEEIKRRLNSGNACYHSVQNLLSSPLLTKNVKIRICKAIILPVVLYGSETWSLTLRKEHRLRVFENREGEG